MVCGPGVSPIFLPRKRYTRLYLPISGSLGPRFPTLSVDILELPTIGTMGSAKTAKSPSRVRSLVAVLPRYLALLTLLVFPARVGLVGRHDLVSDPCGVSITRHSPIRTAGFRTTQRRQLCLLVSHEVILLTTTIHISGLNTEPVSRIFDTPLFEWTSTSGYVTRSLRNESTTPLAWRSETAFSSAFCSI
jgi:hypothetical protein